MPSLLSSALLAIISCLLIHRLDAHPFISSSNTSILLDDFSNPSLNNLGHWHGGDPRLNFHYEDGALVINPTDPGLSYYTRFSNTCANITYYDGMYLHLVFEGSNSFSIALQQHNIECDDSIAPYPESWDEVDATRYAFESDIYVPISHFDIEKSRAVGFAFRGFYTSDPTILKTAEIVSMTKVPIDFPSPDRVPSGVLKFACTRNNSFAFTIDDGAPELAQEVMQIIKDEGILVTFFAVGSGLADPDANFSNVYREMQGLGHQIGLHSYTHPKYALCFVPPTLLLPWANEFLEWKASSLQTR
jgi:hypothetical protein